MAQVSVRQGNICVLTRVFMSIDQLINTGLSNKNHFLQYQVNLDVFSPSYQYLLMVRKPNDYDIQTTIYNEVIWYFSYIYHPTIYVIVALLLKGVYRNKTSFVYGCNTSITQ